ncbi:hypothetical protein FM038_25395 [Shewanella eurypsychrophilus]|uniref:Uncharacterized protein n=1 Tax=Shewanella eurypsychrophilus TaxID=2593656 RepID=A0ABX8S978_9GAMM|nr:MULTISPECIES: hypothetical protein [Shewanella]QXP45000.1 hypothetical protein FM038_25395 [Shewanella eurypsychrophilus]
MAKVVGNFIASGYDLSQGLNCHHTRAAGTGPLFKVEVQYGNLNVGDEIFRSV